MTGSAWLLAAPLGFTIALFFAPLALMVCRSLTDAAGAPTLAHYLRFVADPYYVTGLFVTLGTAALVTLVTLAGSYPVAYAYWRSGPRTKSVLVVLLLSPFYANVVVKVFGWMVILPGDLLNSYAGLVLVSIHRAMPFMVLLLASAMARIEPEWIESARMCGARGSRVLRTIVLPLSIPGAAAGGSLVFSLTVAAYVVPALVGGRWRGRFLPVQMYQQITIAQDWGFGAAIGVVLLVTSVMTMAAVNRALRSANVGRIMRDEFTT